MKLWIFNLIFFTIVAIVMAGIFLSLYDRYGFKTQDELGNQQCQKFNYTYYKTEQHFISFDIWCFDKKGNPINTGEFVKDE